VHYSSSPSCAIHYFIIIFLKRVKNKIILCNNVVDLVHSQRQRIVFNEGKKKMFVFQFLKNIFRLLYNLFVVCSFEIENKLLYSPGD